VGQILLDHADIGFMYQRCALQSMAGTLTAQVVLGNLPEFVIDKGDEGIEDLAVSAPPPAEQFCDLTRRSLMQGCAPKRHARDPCAQETYIRLTTVNEMKTGTLTPNWLQPVGIEDILPRSYSGAHAEP